MPQYNIKEFIELRDKYDSITLEQCSQIKSHLSSLDLKKQLTGFGSCYTCSLCKNLIKNDIVNCELCVWALYDPIGDSVYCAEGLAKETYDNIYHATDPEELLIAYKERVKLMTKVIDECNLKNI